jgi:hypothetical protein
MKKSQKKETCSYMVSDLAFSARACVEQLHLFFIKLHVGKSCNKLLCKDLSVGGWKINVVTDPVTGESSQSEYLGDVIAAIRKHD